MYVVTNDEMRSLDERTIAKYVPGLTLMERAGQGIFEAVSDLFDSIEGVTVSIFLGKGNNAGDGLVVARLLAEAGAGAVLHLLHGPEELSPDAYKNWARLEGLRGGGKIEEVRLFAPGWEDRVIEALRKSSLAVDALLGTGIDSPVRESYARAIEIINGCGLPVVAVDVPSGINGTTGETMGAAVAADLTVTMALPKYGSLFYPGKAFTGMLEVVDIGIPDEVMDAAGLMTRVIDRSDATGGLPSHEPAAHKFARGALLVVAGSRRYSGAAVLTALSALRTGCGIVYLAGPESIRQVAQSSAPELIFVPLAENEAGSSSPAALDFLLKEVRCDAAAIGPGMTTDEETVELVREFAGRFEKPLVIDADGINAFAGDLEALSRARRIGDTVVTPHSGELKRLTGKDVPAAPAGRIGLVRSISGESGLVIVHKGAPTIVAHPGGRVDVNPLGHPGMATAGTGDVLTGAIGGFLAQGAGAGEAARLGVYFHSRAADMAAVDTGERGMLAGDCSRALPEAIRELEEEIGR